MSDSVLIALLSGPNMQTIARNVEFVSISDISIPS
jgi:hypothetical protein